MKGIFWVENTYYYENGIGEVVEEAKYSTTPYDFLVSHLGDRFDKNALSFGNPEATLEDAVMALCDEIGEAVANENILHWFPIPYGLTKPKPATEKGADNGND